MSTGALFHDEMSETTGIGMYDWVISERVLARWRRLVAFMKSMNHLHWVMRALEYRRITVAIETAIKVGTYYIFVLFAVALVAARAIRSE
jgi:hypothetical protein